MKTKNILPILIVGFLILVSCEKDYLTTSDTSTPIDTNVALSYSGVIQPIFTANCLGSGCHVSGGVPPTLELGKSYDQITQLGYADADTPDTIPAKSKLYQRMIDVAKPMPPKGKLSAGNLRAIELWIQQGVKNN